MLQNFIQDYGYYAVFIGAFLEGETILILAGFAAYRGYLKLEYVILTAFIASLLGDQFYFWLGRCYGYRLINRFESIHKRAVKVEALLYRFHAPLILAIRFLYGLRIVGPIVIGMSRVSMLKFTSLNTLGAIIWAIAIGGAGYLFGNTLELLLKNLHRYEAIAVAAIVIAGFIGWLIYHLRRKRKKPDHP